jgi:hypothetical protein
MAHTKMTTAFARGGRLTPAEMSLGEEARQVWLVVTSNKLLRELLMATPVKHIIYRLRKENERSDPLELLARIIVTMAAVGYPESTVDLLILHLQGVKARCYVGNAHRSLDELDVEEVKHEAQENELAIRRRIAGDAVTPEQLLAEAQVNELEATLQFERAKELRRRARQAPGRVLSFRREFARPGVTS